MKEEQEFPCFGAGYLKSLGKIGPLDRHIVLKESADINVRFNLKRAEIRINLQETNMSDRNQCDGIALMRSSLHMGFISDQASKGHLVDVLAVRGDEGRITLR